VRKAIHTRFPDHGILGEEGGETKGTAPYRWVIDPIDGTRAFICGIPVWTTLIGLEENGTPIAGIIDQPFTKERWIGTVKGTAAYETQHQSGIAKCSSCDDLSMARLMVTDMRADEYLQPDEAEAIAALAARVQVTRQGLDAYGIGLVASGHMDLVIEAGLSWYDIAACMPVIKAAGGTIMTWKGGKVRSDFHRGRIIIAATEELAAQAAYDLEKVA
ncbi:MAG: inositol monophosphatase family protein, partial [Pseudomonadota bacterium]